MGAELPRAGRGGWMDGSAPPHPSRNTSSCCLRYLSGSQALCGAVGSSVVSVMQQESWELPREEVLGTCAHSSFLTQLLLPPETGIEQDLYRTRVLVSANNPRKQSGPELLITIQVDPAAD